MAVAMDGANYTGDSRKSEIIGACVTLLILPTLAVCLRFMSRLVSRAGFWVGQWEVDNGFVSC